MLSTDLMLWKMVKDAPLCWWPTVLSATAIFFSFKYLNVSIMSSLLKPLEKCGIHVMLRLITAYGIFGRALHVFCTLDTLDSSHDIDPQGVRSGKTEITAEYWSSD